MKSKFPGAVPEIPVGDINEAAAYYEDNLGFTVDWRGEKLGLAGISKGNCRMFLASSDYRKGYGNTGPVLTWLNLESKEEVDDLYRLWSASNAKLIAAPESKPWGLHEFTAADPDGNLFRVFYDFATPERVNGLAVAIVFREVVERVTLLKEAVDLDECRRQLHVRLLGIAVVTPEVGALPGRHDGRDVDRLLHVTRTDLVAAGAKGMLVRGKRGVGVNSPGREASVRPDFSGSSC